MQVIMLCVYIFMLYHFTSEKMDQAFHFISFHFILYSLFMVAPSANAAFHGAMRKTLQFKIQYTYLYMDY